MECALCGAEMDGSWYLEITEATGDSSYVCRSCYHKYYELEAPEV